MNHTLASQALLCLLVFVASSIYSSDASSVYVGRHEPGNKIEQEIMTRKGCEDLDADRCQRIMGWFGADMCDVTSLRKLCPRTCGMCGECKDKYGVLCTRLAYYCEIKAKSGAFVRQNCAESCGICELTKGKQHGSEGEDHVVALV